MTKRVELNLGCDAALLSFPRCRMDGGTSPADGTEPDAQPPTAHCRAELYTCWVRLAGLSPLKSLSLVNSAKCDLVSQISNMNCTPGNTGWLPRGTVAGQRGMAFFAMRHLIPGPLGHGKSSPESLHGYQAKDLSRATADDIRVMSSRQWYEETGGSLDARGWKRGGRTSTVTPHFPLPNCTSGSQHAHRPPAVFGSASNYVLHKKKEKGKKEKA